METAPEWVEGLRWFFMAFLLACAAVGPIVLKPWLNKISTPPSSGSQPTVMLGKDRTMQVLGGALADSIAVTQLTEAINRLTDCVQLIYQLQLAENEEDKMRRRMRDLLEEMKSKESKD